VLQTLFYIPTKIGDVPLFGPGVLLVLWAIGSIGLLVWLVRRQGFNADTRAYLPVLLLLGLAIYFLPKIVGDTQGLPVRGYGVMLLLAVASSVGLLVARGKRIGIDPELIFSLSFWLFVAGILGARVFFVIQYWNESFYQTTKDGSFDFGATVRAVLNISQGGLVVFGSLIGGAIAALIFIRKHKLPTLVMGDLMAPCIVLGMAIGRIGCFLNGCCHGAVCDLPWAVQFPHGSEAYVQQVEDGSLRPYGIVFADRSSAPPKVEAVEEGTAAKLSGLQVGETVQSVLFRTNSSAEWKYKPVSTVAAARDALRLATEPGHQITLAVAKDGGYVRQLPAWNVPAVPPVSLPVHPAQLYSAIDAFLLFFVLLAYEPFQRRNGELLALLLVLHPISRFTLEIIRVDEPPQFGTPLSISQLISILAVIGGCVLWRYILSNGVPVPPRNFPTRPQPI